MSKIIRAKIQNGEGCDKEWSPEMFHRVHPYQAGTDKHWWRVKTDESMILGIEVLGEDGVRRTKGRPVSAQKVEDKYGEALDYFSRRLHFSDPLSMRLLCQATLLTESRGRTGLRRYESHLKDWSFGPAQFLTRTARSLALKLNKEGIVHLPPPPSLVPPSKSADLTNFDAWEGYLNTSEVLIPLLVGFHKANLTRFKTKMDPVLQYAAYNAGTPRPSVSRPWGLTYWDSDLMGPKPGSLDHFAAWYGDVCDISEVVL